MSNIVKNPKKVNADSTDNFAKIKLIDINDMNRKKNIDEKTGDGNSPGGFGFE